MRTAILFLMAGTLAACGQDAERSIATEEPITAEDIRESAVAGEAAAQSKPQHGFRVYPGAKVTASILNGLTLIVETDASDRELAAFYTRELQRLGWTEISETEGETNGSIMLEGRKPSESGAFMAVGISKSTERDRVFALSFIRAEIGD